MMNSIGKPPSNRKSPSSKQSSDKMSNSKSQKLHLSSSPSANASNQYGRKELDQNLRSVLAHELCLPLLVLLHGKDPIELRCLQRVSHSTTKPEWGDQVLAKAINMCTVDGTKDFVERQLTEAMTEEVNKLDKWQHFDELDPNFKASKECPLKQDGRPRKACLDILFSDCGNQPLATVEVGLINDEWLKKLHQSFNYMDLMLQQTEEKVKFGDDPLLLICLTVEHKLPKTCKTQLAVFLCTKRGTAKSPAFRTSLLWHDAQSTLTGASASFGKVLRAVSDLSVWRKHVSEYEYLSSTCCKVGTRVLRCYDYRVRHTERSPLFYRHHPDIVEEYKDNIEVVCHFGETDLANSPGDIDQDNWTDWGGWDDQLHQKPSSDSPYADFPRCDFWEKRGALLIISVPFIQGSHRAESPKAFVPVLNQLSKLHSRKLVFGDVRGLNVVFTDDGKEGTLIDFDLCGPAGEGRYPEGYRDVLQDGRRRGEGGQPLQCWHDIDALVRLIFDAHKVQVSGENRTIVRDMIEELESFWIRVDPAQGPSTERLQKAIDDLTYILDSTNLTLEPSIEFAQLLRNVEDDPNTGTKAGATGSPPKMQGR